VHVAALCFKLEMMFPNGVERSLRDGLLAICCWMSLFAVACSGSGDISDRTVLPPGAAGGTGGPAVSCVLGQIACNNICIDPRADAHNCGECSRDCKTGTCSNAACVCPTTETSCATGCIDTATDILNCGGCGRACAPADVCQQGQCLPLSAICTPACVAGQVCSNGMCKCPELTSFCGGACVDTKITPQHCGKCDAPCTDGQLCQAGACICPPGQMVCANNQCADLQISPQNCGMCGKACGVGEACMAGVCRAPSGADGCMGGVAQGIAITEVAAYQSIKIPLSKGAMIIDPAQRVGIVQGRPTLFRVAVTPSTGFTPRMLSARVAIKNGANEDQYYAKQMVTKASTDADTASAFQISVPPEKIAAATTYSVELVECGAPPAATGASMDTRVPATGDTPLMAADTGTLRVMVIPLSSNAHMPDTTDKSLQIYKDYLLAMYPVSKVEITVGKAMDVVYPVNWNNVIEQLRTQRQADKPTAETYYYGFLKPTDTLKDYCKGGCTAGVGYVGSATQAQTRVALGLAFADETSASTMAHEVGHNHGRQHAPCAPGNQIQGVDPNYPYAGAKTGVWGYDSRKKTFFDPTKTTDIMGYCDPKWVSDYTYKGLLSRSSMINKASIVVTDPGAIQRYRAMIVDEDGPRWSQPFMEPGEPFGTPEDADILDIDGNPIERVTVYRTQIGDNVGATVLVPEPSDGWSSIKLNDALPLSFSAPITIPAPR
jgi:hypothetical protein